MVLLTQKLSAIEAGNFDGLQRSEACFYQKLQLAPVAESCNHASDPGGIKSGQQQSTRFSERMLEFHLLLEHGWPWAFFVLRDSRAIGLIGFARVIGQQLKGALGHIRTRRH